ncbi:MAG: xanthine dehydrogenase family protein molybdopterin-binding subunit [Burkholderiaceae bacterium]|nr:xanthine dehydrogenase family protein molybdopterin-binding subunit [Burkholderiaceae bacterium]
MTTTRREFLKTSTSAAGVAVLGMYVPGFGGKEANAAGSLHTPNVWVHIADNNEITLISHMSEMGQGVHTSLPALIAEELNVDITKVKVATAAADPAYVNGLLGAQITGGSTAIRDAWEKLRIGGAQVRTMLVEAAANKWGVAASSLKAENGVVSGGGKSATYGELASAAASVPVPKEVKLKDPSQFNIVGKAIPRLDTPAKVNGTAEFGIDVKVPGMVYASVEMSPVIGGQAKSFDDSAVRGMPGIVGVYKINGGVGIVADSYWRAYKARKALKVDWDLGPGANLSTKGMWDGTKAAEKSVAPIKVRPDVGNANDALQGAAKVLKAEYYTQHMAHQPLEPMNMVAIVSGDKCELIGPTQFQQGAQGFAAAAIGLKPENVSVRTTYLGGGFGRRIVTDFVVQAAELSKASGRPVKVLWSREDDMKNDWYRPQSLNRMEGGLDASGKPVAIKHQISSQSITQVLFGLPKNTLDPFMVEAAVAPYDVPNTSHDLIIHDTGIRVGYLRAVSHTMNCFANESFMDELAHAAGKDPVKYRMELLSKEPRFANVLKIAADKAGWGKKLPAGRAMGVALMEGYGTYMAQIAEVSVSGGDIKVHKVTVACDCGRMVNPGIVRQQLESGIVYGLSHALYSDITVTNGRVDQNNFNDFRILRTNETPVMDITLVDSNEKPGGTGEPSTSLIAPAVANAVFTATGKRLRSMPFAKALKSA